MTEALLVLILGVAIGLVLVAGGVVLHLMIEDDDAAPVFLVTSGANLMILLPIFYLT